MEAKPAQRALANGQRPALFHGQHPLRDPPRRERKVARLRRTPYAWNTTKIKYSILLTCVIHVAMRDAECIWGPMWDKAPDELGQWPSARLLPLALLPSWLLRQAAAEKAHIYIYHLHICCVGQMCRQRPAVARCRRMRARSTRRRDQFERSACKCIQMEKMKKNDGDGGREKRETPPTLES